MRRRRSGAEDERRSLIAAGALVLAIVVVSWLAFRPPHPSPHQELKAVVANANQLRPGSPVRIAGINSGTVTRIEKGPGDTATVVMRIERSGLPLHRDATLKIRPRLFLEGGFYVDLKAGTPSAPHLADHATLPVSQTARAVQFNELLSTFDTPTRASLQDVVSQFDAATGRGGVRSLRRTARALPEVLRDVAWVADAAQGERTDDVSQLIASAATLSTALGSRDADLQQAIGRLRTTADALDSGDGALGRTLVSADRLLRDAPPRLARVHAALRPLRVFSRAAAPGFEAAPRLLPRVTAAIAQLGTLVTPAARPKLVGALRSAFVSLPRLVNQLDTLLAATAAPLRCLQTHVTPILKSTVPDGRLTTGPVYQDFFHALAGLSGVSQNFDANGYNTRYDAGISASGVSLDSVPGIGQVVTSAPPIVQARPQWLGPGTTPTLRTDVDCDSQPRPDLSAASAVARNTPTGVKLRPVTHARLVKALSPFRPKAGR